MASARADGEGLDAGGGLAASREIVKRLDLVTVPDRRYERIGFDGNVSMAPVDQAVIVFCG